MDNKNKENRGGILGLFKKPKKNCCGMDIVEIKDKPKKSRGCCDIEIIPQKDDKGK